MTDQTNAESPKGYDPNWEENIYKKGIQLNKYPFGPFCSYVFRLFGSKLRQIQENPLVACELGCGAGNNLMMLAEEGFDVHGIDGSETAIQTAKNRAAEKGLKGSFQVGDVTKDLPFDDGSLDLIVDRACLSYNTVSTLERIYGQISKKLKPGGIFLSFSYSVHCQGYTDVEHRKAYETEPGTLVNSKIGPGAKTGSPVHFFTEGEIAPLLAKADLKLKSLDHYQCDYVFPKKEREYAEFAIVAEKPA